MPQQQALLKRNPSMTREEFSAAWLHHGLIVLPYFLSYGFEYYAQIHAPLSSTDPVLESELHEWDGAAESIRGKKLLSVEEEEWRSRYYQEVILPDERRFLVSAALEHLKVVEGVTGEKRVVIEDGKGMFEVPEDVMRVWREYENGGNGRARSG